MSLLKLELDDPLTRRWQRLIKSCNFMVNIFDVALEQPQEKSSTTDGVPNIFLDSPHESYMKAYYWIEALKTSWEAGEGQKIDSSLAFLLEEFAGKAQRLEFACAGAAHALASLESSPRALQSYEAKSYEAKIAAVRRELIMMQSLIAAATPTHLALQAHMSYLFFMCSTLTHFEYATELESLSSLRDKFFAKPKVDLLVKYLQLTGELVDRKPQLTSSSSNSKPRMTKFYRAKLDSYSTELEVLMLTEAIFEA